MFVYLGYFASVYIVYKLYKLLPAYIEPLYKKYSTDTSWCLITGCTDGIGQAMAVYLAKKKWNLILIGRNSSKLETLKTELASFGVQLKIVQVDFSDDLIIKDNVITSSHSKIEVAVNEIPQLNMIINNAGVSQEYPNEFSKETISSLKNIVNVNILGVIVTTKIALPKLKGCIVNLGSFSGLFPSPLLSVYSGSKVFLEYLGNCLAIEEQIDVIHLDTYFVSTKMSKMRPNLFCPTAEQFAASVMEGKLGCKTGVGYTGYWSHAILKWGINNLMTDEYWMNYVYRLHQSIQKRAIKKKKANK
eukprot:NODE_233_length_13658_cov_0.453647.p4 type:complete len:303 gc:universal NODE_233_length_13658_cov_0.453647:2078-1170(-)